MKREEPQQDGGWGTGSHPLLAASSAIHRGLDSAHGALAAGSDPAWLAAADQGRLLEDLARARQRLDALLIATLAGATSGAGGPEGVTSLTGARTPADWLAHRLHVRPGRLAGQARLGAAVAERTHLATALAAGTVTVDHARAVTDVLADLPLDQLDPGVAVEAEHVLVGRHPAAGTPPGPPPPRRPRPRRRRGGRGSVARRDRARSTARHDPAAAAHRPRHPEDHPEDHRGDPRAPHHPAGGRAAGDREPPTRHHPRPTRRRRTTAHRLPTARPRVLHPGRAPPRRPAPHPRSIAGHGGRHRRGAEAAPRARRSRHRPPRHRHRDLTRRAAPSELPAPHPPAVLGGASQVLDLGRDQRFFTRGQRTALGIAHRECQADGCTIPAAWCEAHHRRRWTDGGRTDLADGALLCSHHHHRTHDPAYDTRWVPEGSVTFHRRC